MMFSEPFLYPVRAQSIGILEAVGIGGDIGGGGGGRWRQLLCFAWRSASWQLRPGAAASAFAVGHASLLSTAAQALALVTSSRAPSLPVQCHAMP